MLEVGTGVNGVVVVTVPETVEEVMNDPDGVEEVANDPVEVVANDPDGVEEVANDPVEVVANEPVDVVMNEPEVDEVMNEPLELVEEVDDTVDDREVVGLLLQDTLEAAMVPTDPVVPLMKLKYSQKPPDT